jgi:hypothetical protein
MRSIERTAGSRWILRSTLPLLMVCAGCTTVSVDGANNDKCSEYVPPQWWEPTPHAPPPGTTQASHGSFEIAEAGQLEKANDDKGAIKHVIGTCERKQAEALERATRRNSPWYKRIF